MFTLLSGFWKYLWKRDEFFAVILGLDNAGKTTLLENIQVRFRKNYKAHDLSKITTTVGLNIGRIDVAGVRLSFWDLGGQGELQLLWDKYYKESHAIIYVVDSNDRERMDDSLAAFKKMLENSMLQNVPLLLVANKQDIEGVMSVAEIKAIFAEHRDLIGDRACKVMGASALKGEGISEGIDFVVDKMKQNAERRPPHDSDEYS